MSQGLNVKNNIDIIHSNNSFDFVYDMSTVQSFSNPNNNYIYLEEYFNQIEKLDIQFFNILLFKNEFENLDNKEYEIIFEERIRGLLDNILLDISLLLPDDTVLINNEVTSKLINKNLFIDFIEFYMYKLPYVYLSEILNKYESNIDFFEELNNNPEIIKEKINNQIDKFYNLNINLLKIINNLSGNISTNKARDKNEVAFKLFQDHVSNKKEDFNSYKNLISETYLSDLINLINVYIERDSKNIRN